MASIDECASGVFEASEVCVVVICGVILDYMMLDSDVHLLYEGGH